MKLRTRSNQIAQIKVAHLLSGARVWGVENYVHNLLSAECSSILESTIVCTSAGAISQKFIDAGFDVEIIPMKGYLDFGSVLELKNLFETHGINIVHTHLGLDSMLGTLAAKLAHIPAVTSVHFDQPNYVTSNPLRRALWSKAQLFKNKAISHFFPITENVAEELCKRESVPRNKITVVHPGIPVFETKEYLRTKIRDAQGTHDTSTVIIGVGRLELEKNFACLLDAMANFEAKDDIELWLVGDGSQRKALETRVADLKLSEKVKILGYRPDVTNLLSAADIFVLPSKFEPFGMSAVEAMLSGLPVVGTNGPGLGTIVQDQITGLLVTPDDSEDLYLALARLAKEKNLRQKFGELGKKRAIEKFTAEKMAAQILSAYCEIMRRDDLGKLTA